MAVLVWTVLRSTDETPRANTAGASPTAVSTPIAPTHLHVTKSAIDSLTVEWMPAQEAAALDSFAVYRDGTLIATLPGNVTSYRDTGLAPATRYEYSVVANRASAHSAFSEPLSARTDVPPLAVSRLGGSWRVAYTVTSSNLSNQHPGTAISFFWKIKPRCATGPCSASLSIPLKDADPAGGVLRRHGVKYEGRILNASLGFCGNTSDPYDDSAVINIQVTKAATREGEWRALRFEGTFREYFPPRPSLGCTSAFLEADVSGFLRS